MTTAPLLLSGVEAGHSAVGAAVPATGAASLAWLLIAVPALSAAILLLVGRASDA